MGRFDAVDLEVVVDDAGLVIGEGLGQSVFLEPDLDDMVPPVI